MSGAQNKSSFPHFAETVPFNCFLGTRSAKAGMFLLLATRVHAEATNTIALAPELPNASASFVRVIGALALVIGVFLGGVWFFKNWQRLAQRGGNAPKLNILESKSLGARQGIFVIGYEKQRFLVASSPTGVNLLSHLPDAENGATEATEKTSAPMPFAQALATVLKGK